jgi:membrane fusion protein (multidrug efflux system)
MSLHRAPALGASRAAGAALLVALAALTGCKGGSNAAQAPPPIEVGVVKVAQRPVTVYEEYVAQAQAANTIDLRSQVTGLLERQVVPDGAQVRKGDLLYQIDPRPFEAAVAQAEANLAQAQARQVNAQQTLTRYDELVGQGFVSKQQYQNAQADQKQAAAQVRAMQAALRDARLNLDYTRIRAPREGYLSESQVRAGSLVTAQQTLLNTLYSSDPMYVYFSVSEDRAAIVQREFGGEGAEAGQARKFQLELPDSSQHEYTAQLNFVDPAVNQRTGTLRARIAVPNPDARLRPGMFVRLRVPSVESGNALTVPQKAVTELQGLKLVYVIGTDGKPQQRQIVADVRSGGDWVVEKGLAPGDMVIVEGLPKIQMMPNAPVKPVVVANQPAAPPANAGTPAPPGPATGSAAPAASGNSAEPSSVPHVPNAAPGQAPSTPAKPPPARDQRGTPGVPATAG